MKKYFVSYGDFGNVYDLTYTEDGSNLEGWDRITRKEAEALARAETRRREHDPNFANYAPEYITPYFCNDIDGEKAYAVLEAALMGRGRWRLDGRVVVRN